MISLHYLPFNSNSVVNPPSSWVESGLEMLWIFVSKVNLCSHNLFLILAPLWASCHWIWAPEFPVCVMDEPNTRPPLLFLFSVLLEFELFSEFPLSNRLVLGNFVFQFLKCLERLLFKHPWQPTFSTDGSSMSTLLSHTLNHPSNGVLDNYFSFVMFPS